MADEGFQKAGMSNGSGVGIVLFYVIQKVEVYLGGYDRTTRTVDSGRSVCKRRVTGRGQAWSGRFGSS